MMLDVFSYHFHRYLIPHRADKISIFPKFSAPQLFLYFWMLLEYYARTYPLQHTHNLCNAISWRECQKYVNMIWGYLQRVYFKFMMLCYFSKYLLYSFLYFSSQYPLPLLRCPDQMIFRIIHCMACSFKYHAFPYIMPRIAFGKKLFIPAYKAGYSSFDFS
jgi:hypothetical protein